MINTVLAILRVVFLVLSAVSFFTAVFIFFKFRIVEVVQDLNGTIARKQIEQMRKRNENAKNFGAELLDGSLETTGGLGRSGRMGRSGRLGASGRTGHSGATGQPSPYAVGNLQDMAGQPGGSAGTTVLQTNKIINPNFTIIKNIVYINTQEYI